MISVYSWDAATKKCRQGGGELLPGRDAVPDVLWVDLNNPTPEEEKLTLEQFFPVHALTLEDMTRPRREPDQPPHFPKVEEFSRPRRPSSRGGTPSTTASTASSAPS
jgi:magnesium transporter